MKRILSLLVIFTALIGANAKDSRGANIDPALDDLIRSYMPWQSAEFSGKLRMDGLGISPTVKMYMVYDSLIQVSVRVPLLGEVGRLELSCSEILIVNKMKHTYCKESTDNLMRSYPTVIQDLQSLFLARVTVLGAGQLGLQNYNIVDLEKPNGDTFRIIPSTDGVAELSYWYEVGSNGRTQLLNFELQGIANGEVKYSYENRGMDMDILFVQKGKRREIDLDFSTVKWGGSKMSAINLSGYKRQDIKTFINSSTH